MIKKLVKLWDNNPVAVGLAALCGVFTILFIVHATLYWLYNRIPSFKDIFIESNGLLFDVLLFGVIILHYDKKKEKRDLIKRYHEEIEDYREWKSSEAAFRIAGIIRRLNQEEAELPKLTGAYLAGVNLTGAKLQGAQLTETDLTAANLSEAKLQGAELSGTNLYEAKLDKAKLTKAILSQAKLNKAKLDGINLSDADLRKAELREVSLCGAKLLRANLSEAKLDGRFGNLRGANLSKADLSKADLSGISLWEANLSEANLYTAKLIGANLRETDLTEANLCEADLTHVRNWREIKFLDGAKIAKSDMYPEGFYEWACDKGAVDVSERANDTGVVDEDG